MSGAVTLERPADGVVLRELAGEVARPAAETFAALAARLDPRGESAFVVDPASRRLVLQGGYWYRGEYAVEPTGAGCSVRLTIVNVAPGSKLLGALTGRSALRAAPGQFSALLAALGASDQRST